MLLYPPLATSLVLAGMSRLEYAFCKETKVCYSSTGFNSSNPCLLCTIYFSVEVLCIASRPLATPVTADQYHCSCQHAGAHTGGASDKNYAVHLFW